MASSEALAPSHQDEGRPGRAGLSRRAAIIGVSVREMTAETVTAIVRVKANSRNRRPMMPSMKRRGMKTAMRDKVSDTIGEADLARALVGGLEGAWPSSIWRTMFSIITMASSTTNPAAIVRAMSDRLSMVKPAKYITPKLLIRESGSVTAATRVALKVRRNSSTTRITRATLSTRVSWTSWTDALMVAVRSLTTESVALAGTECCSACNWRPMRSTVSTMLAPGWRCTSMMTAGLP